MPILHAVKSYLQQRLQNFLGVTQLKREQAAWMQSVDGRLQAVDARLQAADARLQAADARLQAADARLEAVQKQVVSIEDWHILGLLARGAADGRHDEQLVPWRFPVWIAGDGRPCFQPRQGRTSVRVVVCSLPKAGTYLVAEVLRGLGLVPAGVHVDERGFTDYRFASFQQARHDYRHLDVEMPLRQTLLFLLPGQFVVGHLPCTPSVLQTLIPFRKLFVYRDLREGVVSFMRFISDAGRGGERMASWSGLPDGPDKLVRMLEVSGQEYFDMVRPMLPWRGREDAFPVAFEMLLGDRGQQAQSDCVARLAEFLGAACSEQQVQQVLKEALAAETMTRSSGRTDWRVYWSDAAERQFRVLGGEEMIAALGCQPSE